MRQVAKLCMNGRSQAVRLPSSFRFDCDTVYIRKDAETGDVILSRKPGTWDDFFELVDSLEIPRDFISSRENEPASERHLF
jgi:antitoxin VapB